MSVEALSWAFDIQLENPTAKLVLVAIANSADHQGVAFVGRARLARVACCSPRTVSRALALLEECELLHRERRHRKNGSRTSDWQYLHLGQVPICPLSSTAIPEPSDNCLTTETTGGSTDVLNRPRARGDR